MQVKVIKLPLTFPLSEVFAHLEIYLLRKRVLEDGVLVEMDTFDAIVLKEYLEKEGIIHVYTEL